MKNLEPRFDLCANYVLTTQSDQLAAAVAALRGVVCLEQVYPDPAQAAAEMGARARRFLRAFDRMEQNR